MGKLWQNNARERNDTATDCALPVLQKRIPTLATSLHAKHKTWETVLLKQVNLQHVSSAVTKGQASSPWQEASSRGVQSIRIQQQKHFRPNTDGAMVDMFLHIKVSWTKQHFNKMVYCRCHTIARAANHLCNNNHSRIHRTFGCFEEIRVTVTSLSS